MKFKFKIQKYQTDAVENTVSVFAGQPSQSAGLLYRRDLGKRDPAAIAGMEDDSGYRNHDVALSAAQLLQNIKDIQAASCITPSAKLAQGVNGTVSLDIEMETGTGKTYVYIKTMFELNKRYGWSKFIVVVPSVAIREGVAKSFKMLEEHFMEHYGKKARWFVYDSSDLGAIDRFSSDAGLNVMIINTQAFASSLNEEKAKKEGRAGDKAARIIYSEQDSFASRKPINVIAANRPIIIMDEPQRMEGNATQAGLKQFNPLFTLNYSATHRTRHDTVYALDALDAYRQRLVKRINVIGFEVKNLQGTGRYMYLDDIVLSPNHAPRARIEIEVRSQAGNISRQTKTFNYGDTLIAASGGLNEYDGYTITEISPVGYVTFRNGATIYKGEVSGDTNEEYLQRVQIRETVKAHLRKEHELFRRGIKCLSLFFIDKVENYRIYDAEGNAAKGKFQQILEKEYKRQAEEAARQTTDEEYAGYLRRFEPEQVHKGYFSIDKKGRAIDSSTRRGTDISDDTPAYDLILKDKERLLSFEEPTRFIFSHSALREGWDNPNVFQICTLRHANAEIAKRQEVGRGLRLCVDRDGTRQDAEQLGDEVHDINVLTVIANESYTDFTKSLQKDIHASLRERLREHPRQVTTDYFKGKNIILANGSTHEITDSEAARIKTWLEDNGYADSEGNIQPSFMQSVNEGTLAPMPTRALKNMADAVVKLVLNDPSATDGMITDARTTVLNRLNRENFNKEAFQALWKEINHQYVYTVSYDSKELAANAVKHLDAELSVRQLHYVRVEGEQDAENVDQFGNQRTAAEQLASECTSTVAYDLIGEIAHGANLTRRTVGNILQSIKPEKLALFRNNPEDFIRNATRIIREQKAAMIVQHIHYKMTEGKYSSDIFATASEVPFDRALEANKHVMDYVVTDSKVERDFASDLERATEVEVYAKLPRSFQIPTPVGNYAPDWAIAMIRDGVKHIFFIAETKGSLSSMDISPVEQSKIDCCKQLFEELSSYKVRYHKVTSYEDLVNEFNAVR